MGDELIKKSEASRLVLAEGDGWQSVDEAKVAAVIRALDDPVRRAVLKLLDQGPIRQFELANAVSDALGKKYGNSLMRYHLKPLEQVGLIGFDADPNESRAKIVYRKSDYSIQLKPRPKPVMRARKPKTPEEFADALKVALKREG